MRLFNLAASAFAAIALVAAAPALAQEHGDDHGSAEDHGGDHGGGHHYKTPPGGWSFTAFNGTYDRNALQRGYIVYTQVCSSCHSMISMSFRNLAQPGGPFYDAEYPNPNDNPVVKEIAKTFLLPSIDEETGDEIVVEGVLPTTSRDPTRTTPRVAAPTAARCRRICRSSSRRVRAERITSIRC